MKRIPLFLAAVLSSSAIAGGPSVKPMEEGLFWSGLPGGIQYLVDTVTQLCFVSNTARDPNPVLIPCKNLKKRPEWAAIITWE